MFIAYLRNNDSAARWLIVGVEGAYRYIFPRENFKEMEQDTRVWVYILI